MHQMTTVQETDEGYVAECTVCDRRIILYRGDRGGEIDIIIQGDFYASHTWSSTPGKRFSVAVEQ